jgi:hypothetical protein
MALDLSTRARLLGRRGTMLLAVLMLAAVATPAGAVSPTSQEFRFGGVIEGYVEACDTTLRWEVSGTAERTTFYNADGSVDRVQDKVREANTITNVDTGETLREGPDSFQQRVLFNDDGTTTLEINGLSVLVTGGEDAVVDAGRLVLVFGPDGPTLAAIVGRHDVREIDPFTTDDPILLEGFCDAFA